MERAKRPYEGTDAYEAGVRDTKSRLRETSQWVWDKNGMDWNIGAWRCKLCGCRNNNLPNDESIYPYNWAGTKYCPNCGRRMLPSNIKGE